MKTRILKQGIGKVTIIVTLFLSALAANAQQKAANIVKQSAAKQGDVGTGLADGGAIRVVDNKGTIKYLQVQNGITQVTSTAPSGGGIVTTWQLGGSLTDDTYIDVAGKIFSLDGIELVSSGLTASIDATDKSIHGTGTGYTFLVRDEVTGAIKKLKLVDLVKGGQYSDKAIAGSDFVYSGDSTVPADINKIWVYRNGVKMLGGVDYNVTGTLGVVIVTVNKSGGIDPEDYSLITGDRIEVQWVR